MFKPRFLGISVKSYIIGGVFKRDTLSRSSQGRKADPRRPRSHGSVRLRVVLGMQSPYKERVSIPGCSVCMYTRL